MGFMVQIPPWRKLWVESPAFRLFLQPSRIEPHIFFLWYQSLCSGLYTNLSPQFDSRIQLDGRDSIFAGSYSLILIRFMPQDGLLYPPQVSTDLQWGSTLDFVRFGYALGPLLAPPRRAPVWINLLPSTLSLGTRYGTN